MWQTTRIIESPGTNGRLCYGEVGEIHSYLVTLWVAVFLDYPYSGCNNHTVLLHLVIMSCIEKNKPYVQMDKTRLKEIGTR